MAQNYNTFLAATVLNDGKVVSYRLLSRELKVHSNAAKRMLFDFHRLQNSKTTGSVHATFLIDGIPKTVKEPSVNGHQADREDAHMQSSPFMSSSMPQEDTEEDTIPIKVVILAKEEDLEAAKGKFEQIHSIHVYSLQPTYIQRRTGQRPPILAPESTKAASIQQAAATSQDSSTPSSKTIKPSGQTSSSRPSTAQSEIRPETTAEAKKADKKPAGKPANLKREQSDIFKSFSNPKPKLKKEDAASSGGASPAPLAAPLKDTSIHEDENPRDTSQDEHIDDFMDTAKTDSQTTKSRSDRAKQLRQMMDDEDKEMSDPIPAEVPLVPSQDSEATERPAPQKKPSPEPPVVATGGRRRGKRRIIKKKMIKDEEGYLVTKEEPVWESFSEDEPAPTEKTPASTASSSAKAKKSGGKPGQGNIMSFFGKK